MGREQLIGDLLPSRVNVGLSALIGITALPGQLALSLQYLTGGTLEIVSATAPVGAGSGFIMPANVILSFDTTGTIWLSSQSATTTVMVLRGRSQGFEGASLGYFG